MKKLMILGTLALALVLASEQSASAWSNIKFGAGVNLHWQTGDNNILWGVLRNGQIPHPGGYGGYGGGYGYGHPGGGFPMYYEPTAADANNNGGAAAGKQSAGAPAPVNQTSYPANPYGYYYPVSYNPYYGYQGYQVPSYWYGQ